MNCGRSAAALIAPGRRAAAAPAPVPAPAAPARAGARRRDRGTAAAADWRRRRPRLLETERGDRIDRRLERRRSQRRRIASGRAARDGGRQHVRRGLRRRLVEVDDDRVALAAHVVRHRLRERDAHARRRRAERLGRLDGDARRSGSSRSAVTELATPSRVDVAEVEQRRSADRAASPRTAPARSLR